MAGWLDEGLVDGGPDAKCSLTWRDLFAVAFANPFRPATPDPPHLSFVVLPVSPDSANRFCIAKFFPLARGLRRADGSAPASGPQRIMLNAARPLAYHQTDLELLSIEAVSDQLRVSRAFVRLCVDSGCPTRKEKLSAAELLQWLFIHYARVRERAGFSELLEVDGLPAESAERVRMANALFTLLEYGESRASDPDVKRQLSKNSAGGGEGTRLVGRVGNAGCRFASQRSLRRK